MDGAGAEAAGGDPTCRAALTGRLAPRGRQRRRRHAPRVPRSPDPGAGGPPPAGPETQNPKVGAFIPRSWHQSGLRLSLGPAFPDHSSPSCAPATPTICLQDFLSLHCCGHLRGKNTCGSHPITRHPIVSQTRPCLPSL